MAIIENIIVPLLQALLYGFMLLGTLYLCYRGIKSRHPDYKWIFKYKVLKKQFDEKNVELCIDAYNGKMEELTMKKSMLLGGKSIKEVDELMYIFKQVCKKLEGGIKK